MLPLRAGTLALAVCLSTAVVAPRAEAAPSAMAKAAAVAKGIFVDGPKHTWQGIKQHPKTFGALVLGTGLLGGVSHSLGINPEPYLMAAATGLYGWSVKRALPRLKLKKGLDRLRAIGSEILWPAAMISTSFVVGHAVGGESTHSATPDGVRGFARAFGDGAILGGDDPLVLVTTLRKPE
jgi:hypothetical protein